jgi:hypothetical protein
MFSDLATGLARSYSRVINSMNAVMLIPRDSDCRVRMSRAMPDKRTGTGFLSLLMASTLGALCIKLHPRIREGFDVPSELLWIYRLNDRPRRDVLDWRGFPREARRASQSAGYGSCARVLYVCHAYTVYHKAYNVNTALTQIHLP